jgi:hypothetical protein
MRQLLPYYLLMASAGLLGIAKGVLLARMIGMEGFGAYGLAVVLGAAFQFAIGLGAAEGLGAMLPRTLQEPQGASKALRNTLAVGMTLFLRASPLVLVAAVGFTIAGHAAMALSALLGLANALTTLPMILARSQGQLLGFGWGMFLKALLTLAFAAAGALLYGPTGAIMGELAGLMVAVCIIWPWQSRCLTLTWAEARTEDRLLRSQGRPLLLQGVSTVIQQNIERWSVAATLGLAGAGSHGVALLFITAVNLVHATFFQQVGSRVLPQLAAGEPAEKVMRRVLRFASVLGICTFFALGLIAYWANALLNFVFPAFGDFTWGLFWLGASAVAQMLHHSDWILIGRSRQRALGNIAVWSVLLTLSLSVGGYLFQVSLEHFLFFYFIGRLFLLFATVSAATRSLPTQTSTFK